MHERGPLIFTSWPWVMFLLSPWLLGKRVSPARSNQEWLWNAFKLLGQSGYLSEPFQWDDGKMGWRSQQKYDWPGLNHSEPVVSVLCHLSLSNRAMTLKWVPFSWHAGGMQLVPFPLCVPCPLMDFCWLELFGDNVFNCITLEKEIIHEEKGTKLVTKTVCFGNLLKTDSEDNDMSVGTFSEHPPWASFSTWGPFICYLVSSLWLCIEQLPFTDE